MNPKVGQPDYIISVHYDISNVRKVVGPYIALLLSSMI